MQLAPVVLFVYNRPWHTQQTIFSLQNNELAQETELFVYSDGAKNEKDVEIIKDLRNYLRSIDGFKNVNLIERERNLGLARNIIEGITEVITTHGQIIVLEDDIVVSPNFLTFINNALSFYDGKKDVWHISGWNYPIDPTGLPETFLWRVMNCWGWATWKDRWAYFERDPEKIAREFSREDIHRLNLDGAYNFWGQVMENIDGKISSWAIFWYATIFMHNGLCLNPTWSLVQNIGLDGSGVHCGRRFFPDKEPSDQLPIKFQEEMIENKQCVEKIKDYYKKQKESLFHRIWGILKDF